MILSDLISQPNSQGSSPGMHSHAWRMSHADKITLHLFQPRSTLCLCTDIYQVSSMCCRDNQSL